MLLRETSPYLMGTAAGLVIKHTVAACSSLLTETRTNMASF
jgi:hypothetical protein